MELSMKVAMYVAMMPIPTVLHRQTPVVHPRAAHTVRRVVATEGAHRTVRKVVATEDVRQTETERADMTAVLQDVPTKTEIRSLVAKIAAIPRHAERKMIGDNSSKVEAITN